ncbi:unnamed protein product [Prorocentrum cordatum]|uniref:Uncharacterized protein n=1 Tax=Prorocentrum cordatum TaxID=2364126 RepID=A0ABN9S8K1_9DINO|nr:unnamed protein product [Polarella glacialis]
MAELRAFVSAGMGEPVEELVKRRHYSLSASTEDPGTDGEYSRALSDVSCLDASAALLGDAWTYQAAVESQTVLRKLATPGEGAPHAWAAGSGGAAVSQAPGVGQEDEQAKRAEWASWRARRQQRLERRSATREQYGTMNLECRLRYCSSDCGQCRATAS